MRAFLIAFVTFITFSAVSQTDTTVKNYTDINGMKQGYWLKKDINNKKIYEGFFNNNVPIGIFKRYHANGVLKAEMIYDKVDQKKSMVKLYDDTGELAATGAYYDKKKDGVWNFYGAKEKRLMTEIYVRGIKHGVTKKFYPDGTVVEELEWKNGKMDGTWVRYFENGSVRLKSKHVSDKRVGEFIVYYKSGKIELSGAYKNDLKEGVWKFYTEQGVLEREMIFVDGETKNTTEIDAKLAKELKEMEDTKGKIADPENFKENPQEYFQGSGQ